MVYSNPNITKYVPDVQRSREEAKEELEWHMYGNPELRLWVTVRKESGWVI
jgi:hypothetical protein